MNPTISCSSAVGSILSIDANIDTLSQSFTQFASCARYAFFVTFAKWHA